MKHTHHITITVPPLFGSSYVLILFYLIQVLFLMIIFYCWYILILIKDSLRKLYLIYNKINLSGYSIYHYVNIKYDLSGFKHLDYFFLLTKNSESYINYN